MKNRLPYTVGLIALLPLATGAQQVDPTPLNFSGVIFANFQYRGDGGSAKGSNKFDIERTYLNFRIGTGEHTQIRVTADIYQQTSSGADAYYRGWSARIKYAYVQHTYLRGNHGLTSTATVGLLPTAFVPFEETFWPRWLSRTAADRAGWQPSTDLGVSNTLVLPQKFGEISTAIVNGPGYTSRETDRFKDYTARVSITPFMAGQSLFRTLTVAGWASLGATGSKFASGGEGQVGSVGAGLTKNIFGGFVGLKDPNLVVGGDWMVRSDDGESGDNTPISPRLVNDSSGRLLSAYTLIKPFRLMNKESGAPLGFVFRWDRITPNTDTDPYYNVVIAGMTWDINKKTSFAIDYQEQTPHAGINIATIKTYFFHVRAEF
jgi:hypothetical protein